MALCCCLVGGTEQERVDVADALRALGHRPLEGEGADLFVTFDSAALPSVIAQASGAPMVLALSADHSPKAHAALIAAGADDVLSWPAEAALLRSRLDLFERRRGKRLGAQKAPGPEEAVREAFERYRTLFDAVPDAIAVLDPESLALLDVNGAFLRLYGYSIEETRELTMLDMSAEPEKTRDAFARARIEGSSHVNSRWHRRKDGTRVVIEANAVLIRDRGEQRFLCTIRDVTDRAAMVAQLQLGDRMATVGTLAAGAAHEINNPLAYVLSNIGFLEDELRRFEAPLQGAGADVREMRQALAEARSGAERVRDIVRDLKTFAQPDGAAAGPLDVRRPVEVALRMASNELRHRARLVRDLPEPALVEADESQLAQVFLNLLTNAVQALPERPADENEIAVRQSFEGSMVAVEVRDNGRGMSADEARRIFEPFFTTRPVGAGTGLGLSICHGIVSALGGRIELQTGPGRGSAFKVLLPAAGGPRPRMATPPALPQALRTRVLLIEDEPLLARSCVRMLGADYDVLIELDPRAALDRLHANEHFDAVLCDLMMPQMSGIDVFDELERARPTLARRMGFMTGGAFTPRAREFLEKHQTRLLEKPFTADALKSMVRKLVTL